MNRISKLEALNISIKQRESSGIMNMLQKWFIQEFGNKSKWKDDFCVVIGVTLPTLNSWCRGERPKKVDDLIKLSDVTGLSYKELIE